MTATGDERHRGAYPFRRSRYFDSVPPRWEHATVGDVAQAPLLVFPAGAPLRSVAHSMAANRVHSVVVHGVTAVGGGWALVTDADLVGALADDRLDATAGEVATRAAVTSEPDRPLVGAARAMRDRGATHLLVVEAASGEPVGVVSALDLAAAWAWGIG